MNDDQQSGAHGDAGPPPWPASPPTWEPNDAAAPSANEAGVSGWSAPTGAGHPAPAPPWPPSTPYQTAPALVTDRRRTVGMVLGIVGLLVALAPFLSWIRISFGAFEASVNGFGMESSDDFGSSSDTSGTTTSVEKDEDDDFGWILEPIPDGVVVSLLAVGACGLGFALRSWSDDPVTHEVRRQHLKRWWVALALSSIGLLWVIGSWVRFDAEWERQLKKEVGDDPFAAIFLGGVDFEPGYGLMAAGLGFAVMGAGSLVVALQERKVLDAPAPATSPWQQTGPPPPV